jgi:hypothetical protein
MGSQKWADGMEDPQTERDRLGAIHAEREHLIEQIRQSQRTIERSRKLLERLDELLAKNNLKP